MGNRARRMKVGQSCSRRAEVGRQRILCSRFLKARGCRKHHFIDLPGLKGSTRSAHTHTLFRFHRTRYRVRFTIIFRNGTERILFFLSRIEWSACYLAQTDTYVDSRLERRITRRKISDRR